MSKVTAILENEQSTLNLGASLGQVLGNKLQDIQERALSVNLEGDLGAGKTTLTRGLLSSFDYNGIVKSPTYTIVEGYRVAQQDLARTNHDENTLEIFHFDLYRLHDPEELEFMGIRDYFAKKAICLIEWPDRGAYVLPKPDVCITLRYQEQSRQVTIMSDLLSESELQQLIESI